MQSEAESAEVAKFKKRYAQLSLRRSGWKHMWHLVSKYVLMRPMKYGDTSSPWSTPKLTVQGVSDDEALDSAKTSATALGGALWPNAGESFELCIKVPPRASVDILKALRSDDVKYYIEHSTEVMRAAIDEPESGFSIAWNEYLDEQVNMGTSGLYAEEMPDDYAPFRVRSASVETCVIDEGPDGLVDTVHFEYWYTARQVVDKYEDEASQTVKDFVNNGKEDEWIKVIQAIEPRPGGKAGDMIDNKPYRSFHYEYQTGKKLRDTGMDERSYWFTRFEKRTNELYGRSLAMRAMPSIKELNVLRYSYSKALEKIVDPPTGYYTDQLGGGGTIDISAGAKVPLYATGHLPQSQPPVVQLMKPAEPQLAGQRIDSLTARIASKFLVDKLLDFNNKTRMTKGEAEMRGDLRNMLLGGIFSRQIVELLAPFLTWVLSLMWRRKLLGLHPQFDKNIIARMQFLGMTPLVIPQVIADLAGRGKLPIGVRFISPAARAMKADSMNGIEKLTNMVLSFANAGNKGAMDNVDVDELVPAYARLVGAPSKVIRGSDSLKKYRDQQAQAMQAQANAAQQEHAANINQKNAKAAKEWTGAGLPPTTGMQQNGQQ